MATTARCQKKRLRKECGVSVAAATKMKYLVGIDVRTNGIDAVLLDEKGAICRSASESFRDVVPDEGWLEQDPGDWWAATTTVIRELLAGFPESDIQAIGLSGQLHGLVALDDNNNVVRNAILLNDERNAAEYDVIMEENGIDSIVDEDGRGFIPRFVESKLKWLEKYEPNNYKRIRRFVLPKDYIRYQLTGVLSANRGDAARAGFFNTEDEEWDNEIVKNVGFDIVVFPPIAPSNAPCGTVTPQAAADCGLTVGTPVYGASEDTVLEYVGMSLIKDGTLGIVLSSSGIVATATDGIPSIAGGRLQSAVSLDGEKNMVYGCELSCGDSIKWAANALYGDEEDPDEELGRQAERAPIGCHGVIFLPYLMGERSPHIDPAAKAVFYGLSVLARSKDLARSVMEGIVFGLHEIYDLIVKSNHKVEIREIVLNGELCRYPLLKQIVADVFGMRVKLYEGAQSGTAYGAALVAGVGEGFFKDMEAAEALHNVEEVIEPVDASHEKYLRNMRIHSELYQNLRKTFDKD